jgi:coproporphyrinogen III oxidase-like Fe-S oxidoreductase
MEEFLFLGLRLKEGIQLKDFFSRFGQQLLETFPAITGLASGGFLSQTGQAVALTSKGQLVLDDLILRLVRQ